MKYFLSLFILVHLSSCMSYKPVTKNNIKAVYVLFKDSTWDHYSGYKLYDGSTIKWDKSNSNVKTALNNYSSKIGQLQKENSSYLESLIGNKKIIKYTPIKVVPLKEFGYIETNSNELIFYGIMGDKPFIDLTHDRVYY